MDVPVYSCMYVYVCVCICTARNSFRESPLLRLNSGHRALVRQELCGAGGGGSGMSETEEDQPGVVT